MYTVGCDCVTLGALLRTGHNVELTNMGIGTWFGEIGLRGTTVRTCSATAVGDCMLLKLTSKKFAILAEKLPAVGAVLDGIIQDRMAFSLANVPVFAFVHENKPWSKLELLAYDRILYYFFINMS